MSLPAAKNRIAFGVLGFILLSIAALATVVAARYGGSEAASATARGSRLVVEEDAYDFGVLDVEETGRHSFTIRNSGSSDLTLKLLETSCKCTLSKLESATVAPGATTQIELEWKAPNASERFAQGARFETNDPDTPVFDLRIEGRIRSKLAVWPESVYFTDVPRNGRRSLQVAVYSHVFETVRLTKIESTPACVSARLIDAPPPTGPVGEPRFIETLEITCQATGTTGPFQSVLHLDYEGRRPDGSDFTGRLAIPCGGDVVGDVSLHGRNVVGRLLNLGTVRQVEGRTERAYLYARGDAGTATISVADVTPDFLRVRLEAPQKLSETMTRIPLEVEVPPGAPMVNWTLGGLGYGNIELRTSHPDHPKLRFQISLVVAP